MRDYWPVCYWSDLIHTRDDSALCPGCSAAMMTRCIRPRAGRAWPLALPMIPYMRANLARKRTGLARADAIVAVSSTIAADLKARAPELSATPRRTSSPTRSTSPASARGPPRSRRRWPDRTRSISGKLAPNKGTSHLVADRRAREARLAAGDRR